MRDKLRSKAFSAFLAFAAIMALGQPANASDATRIGSLECFVAAGSGFVLGSTKDVSCVFYDEDDEPAESYIGQLQKFGVDIGFTNEAKMVWDVFIGKDGVYEPGSLSGTYAGAAANASLAFGLGASVLVGGLREDFALQPVRIGQQRGLNIAFGIARMKLVEVLDTEGEFEDLDLQSEQDQ